MSDQQPAIDTTATPAPAPQPVPQEAPQPVQQVPQEAAPQPVPQEAPQPVQQVPQEAPQPVQQVTPATTPAVAATPAPVRHQPQPVGEEIDGLEDVDASDLSMPRLQIVHEDAVWEDSLSNERFESLDVILLGLIKQRVLWPSEMGDEASAPLCKSYNHTQGFPGEGFTVQAKGDPMSPLDASGFSAADLQSGRPLDCLACNLKDWGTHPKRDAPWCTEQFLFAVMMGDPDEPVGVPAILTLQRSAMKPAKQYVTAYLRQRKPLFVNRTTLSLDARSRGSVRYAVPKFVKGVATDPAYHAEYADLYRQVREFVSTPRSIEEDETTVTVTAQAQSVSAQPAPAQPQPAPAAAVQDPALPF